MSSITVVKPKQAVSEFWRKAALHVVPLLGIEWSLSLYAIIDDYMIPFAA